MPRRMAPSGVSSSVEQNKKDESNVGLGHPLLDSYLRAIRRSGKAERTIEHYITASKMFLDYGRGMGFPDIHDVKREHIEMWEVSMRERGLSDYTLRNRFVGLRTWIKWLVEEGELSRDPTERMPMPKVGDVDKDVVPVGTLAEILADMEAKAKVRGADILVVRNLAMVSLFYGTGARVTEVCLAERSGLDLDNGTLRFPPANTKAKEGRTVGLSATLVVRLDRYLRRRTDDMPWLFVGRKGRLTRSGAYGMVRQVFGGVDAKISPHDLKHTSATHTAQSGMMGELEMADVYAWKDVEMARRYTRRARQEMAAQSQRMKSPLERLGK